MSLQTPRHRKLIGGSRDDSSAHEADPACDEFWPAGRSFSQMPAPGPSTIVFAIGGSLARADLPALCERARVLLEASAAEVVLCDVRALVDADAVAIDALARLQLTARRLGSRVRVCHASDELCELLALTGLVDVCGLRLEPERQTEEREQRLGVEEEGQLDDPPV
jgi:ABC-type transporter Mla MlaB component